MQLGTSLALRPAASITCTCQCRSCLEATPAPCGDPGERLRMGTVQRQPIKDFHKLMKLARQPGGLKALSDAELQVWIKDRRAGLAAATYKKSRAGWRRSLDEAEAELARRTSAKE